MESNKAVGLIHRFRRTVMFAVAPGTAGILVDVVLFLVCVEFVSCERMVDVFAQADLPVAVGRHFYGCATSLVGTKKAAP